ncbi:MAG TPA: APC family permease [Thermoanaerobaculia bacterium]|nr:APC family permease [Thermoanaerobaculia bacterium]
MSDTAIGHGRLRRELRVPGAALMGLGSILGTGIFVSVGIAAGVAGPAVILAILVAGALATCNALSSAQLAASHPLSGGTYEYGYRYLRPWLGFAAGWMFLCAKSASAATAALGFAGYLLYGLGRDPGWRAPLALAAVAALTAVAASGIRRSHHANLAIVCVTLAALGFFVVAGAPRAVASWRQTMVPFFTSPLAGQEALPALLHAAALMFVAFTGYARIATLGEEVVEPRRTIPRAILLTLWVTAGIYVAVAAVAVGAAGAAPLAAATRSQAAPLEVVARGFGVPGGHWVLAAGAVTAMLGVLLNLLLGLSRVLLAMARRGDMPAALARLDRQGRTPWRAVVVMGAAVAALAAVGSVEATWSFSAFTVLVYYALTNGAALALPRQRRLYSPAWAWAGLLGCLGLAFWVEPAIWASGLLLLLVGWGWHLLARWRAAGHG